METEKDTMNFLKAVADPTRMEIIKFLNNSKNPVCVNALSKRIKVTQSAISQHLRILKQLGLVKSKRCGYFIHYEINKSELEKYKRGFLELLK